MKSISEIMERVLEESINSNKRCKWCSCYEWHKMNCVFKEIERQKEFTQEFLQYVVVMSQRFDGFVGEFDSCRFCNNRIQNGHKNDCIIKELEEYLKKQSKI